MLTIMVATVIALSLACLVLLKSRVTRSGATGSAAPCVADDRSSDNLRGLCGRRRSRH